MERAMTYSIAHLTRRLAVWLLVAGSALGAAELRAAPELTVSFTHTYTQIGSSNWQIVAQVSVQNSGDAAASDVWVALLMGVDGVIDPANDQILADGYIPTLAAGGTEPLTLSFGPLQPGPTNVVIVVDPLNLVGEANETNNTQKLDTVVPPKPLTYRNLTIVDGGLNTGDPDSSYVYPRVFVRNEGTTASGDFFVDLFPNSDAPPAADSAGYPYARVLSVGPGETREVVLPPVWLPDGVAKGWFLLDPANEVAEIDESDNTSGPHEVGVVAPPAPEGSELIVSNVTTEVTPEGHLIYVAEVRNVGTSPTTAPFRLQLYYDSVSQPSFGVPLGDQNFDFVESLGAGESAQASFFWFAPPAELHQSWILVDSANAIAEAQEGNNTFGPLRVDLSPPPKRADLQVEAVEALETAAGIRFRVTVKNAGLAPVGPFDVDVYPDVPSAPLPLDNTVQSISLVSGTGLEPGASRTLEGLWQQPAAGAYTAWIVLDRLNGVPEGDESNNTYGPVAGTVSGEPTCNVMAAGFQWAEIDGDIRYLATLTNQGPSDTGPFEVALFYDLQTSPAVKGSDTPSATVFVGNLGKGESQALSFVWELAPPGTYRAWLVLDHKDSVFETNENDNVLGPLEIVYAASSAPDCVLGLLVSGATCDCQGTPIVSGYCCEPGPSVLPCDADVPNEDASVGVDVEYQEDGFNPIGGADTSVGADPSKDVSTTGTDEGGTSGGDSGCSSPGAATPGAAALTLIALLSLRRRRRPGQEVPPG
jgi:MYXO-CTERM domain-containing protein